MSTMINSPDNLLGAIFFFSYILTALGLTALISTELFQAYGAFSKSKIYNSYRANLVLVFATFAVISFSSLSYHMLNVLIYSFIEWAKAANFPFPRDIFGALSDLTSGDLSYMDIWTWPKSSTFFQDFAEVICNKPVRFWWTQQALFLSIGWNTFMAIEGTKRDIPRLWAYFLLGQILPVSFTLNLFCVALLLAPPPKTERKLYAATPPLQIVSLLVYFLSISQAPSYVGTPWLSQTLLVIRALLFAPYLVLAPSSRLSWRTSVGQSAPRGTLHEAYRPAWKMVLICFVVMTVRQYRAVLDDDDKSAIWEGFRTINDVPAVSALAYDYILGLGSLYVFWVTI